jgi:hypothetical protein
LLLCIGGFRQQHTVEKVLANYIISMACLLICPSPIPQPKHKQKQKSNVPLTLLSDGEKRGGAAINLNKKVDDNLIHRMGRYAQETAWFST